MYVPRPFPSPPCLNHAKSDAKAMTTISSITTTHLQGGHLHESSGPPPHRDPRFLSAC
jgi:hypothetical protein